jgi:hypothetical protein
MYYQRASNIELDQIDSSLLRGQQCAIFRNNTRSSVQEKKKNHLNKFIRQKQHIIFRVFWVIPCPQHVLITPSQVGVGDRMKSTRWRHSSPTGRARHACVVAHHPLLDMPYGLPRHHSVGASIDGDPLGLQRRRGCHDRHVAAVADHGSSIGCGGVVAALLDDGHLHCRRIRKGGLRWGAKEGHAAEGWPRFINDVVGQLGRGYADDPAHGVLRDLHLQPPESNSSHVNNLTLNMQQQFIDTSTIFHTFVLRVSMSAFSTLLLTTEAVYC